MYFEENEEVVKLIGKGFLRSRSLKLPCCFNSISVVSMNFIYNATDDAMTEDMTSERNSKPSDRLRGTGHLLALQFTIIFVLNSFRAAP